MPINIGMAEVARAHPNADGTFRVGLTIPTSTPEGEVELDAIIGNGGSASAQYTVTSGGASSGQARPSVTLSPSNGSPGTVTTADGHGFIPNQSVTVTQSGGPGITGGGGTVQADQSGSIKMSFRISDQTPQGIITVTFTQGANITIAHFDVKRSPSGGGGALTDPAKDTGGQFLDWLNACVNGDLNEIDPECKQAARDLAGLGHSTTEVAACLEDLWKHPKTLGAWCSLEKMGGLLQDWLGHKAHK